MTSNQLELSVINNGGWLISQAIVEKTKMPLELIVEAFQKAQIPFAVAERVPIDREIINIQTNPRVDLFDSPADVVWENEDCQVLFVTENARVHLLFRPKDNVSFETISEEKFLALKQIMKKIPAVFEETFGFADYCEQLIESDSAFGYEIFPGCVGAAGIVDLVDKDKRNLYLLTRGKYQSYTLPNDKLENLKAKLVSALDSSKDLVEHSFIRERVEINMQQALSYRIHAFATLLQGQGILKLADTAQEENKDSCRPDTADSRLHNTVRCIFDHPPEKELLYKNELVQVILNPKPYVGWDEINSRHLLVVPARHVEDCTIVTDDEFLSERQAILNVRAEWKKFFPEHENFVWKQQGIKAGQTVPHLHTQILCANISEIWEYYRLMIQDIFVKPSMVFAPCPDLREGLRNASWTKMI